ncbi:MAG TPA: hypothetical protein VHI32_08940 [Burkholderiales bacterium]|nr:hypothetical protein [Burkholderiales bacterium]
MDTQYTEQELYKFLDLMRDSGLMKSPTVHSRKIAAQKILGVLSLDEKTDLRKLDRFAAVRRFTNKYQQKFHPDSLETYAQRFNSALDDFFNWAEQPMGFRPAGRQRGARQRRIAATNGEGNSAAVAAKEAYPPSAPPSPGEGLIAVPIPLPSGGMAQLYVPKSLGRADAERIAAVAKALAVGEAEAVNGQN